MLKMEVLVGHCFRVTQVVGFQEAESYFYGTEAQVRGIGKILIYKIRVWQIFNAYSYDSETLCYLQGLGAVN